MSKKLLEFNIPNPLPEDYDPILGRSIGEIRSVTKEAPTINPSSNDTKTSVFDDPELDFAYQSPIKEELPELSAEDIAIILNDESAVETISDQEAIIETEDTLAEPENTDSAILHDEIVETESLPQAEILAKDIELAPEITPFETMDGSANEAMNQAEEEHNLSDRWRMIDDEILEEQKEEIISSASEVETKTETEVTDEIAEIDTSETEPQAEEISIEETVTTIPEATETEDVPVAEETQAAEDVSLPPADETESPEEVQPEETELAPVTSDDTKEIIEETKAEITGALFDEPILASPPKPKRKSKGKKRRKAKKTNEFALMGGVFFTGMAVLLLISTYAAPLGKPFSDIASYGIVWSGFAIIGAVIWGLIRNWQMVIVSLLCLLGFVVDIMPTLGDAPTGTSGETNVIGWANVENSPKALQSFVSQGEKNGASLLIVAGANKLIAGDIPNWSVIQIPIANDATSLAVLAKENWRAVTLPGEPTMARPLDNSITVIGVNPSSGAPKENAIINRAANRMGDQESAVLAVGDFGLVAWDRTMKDFTKTSGATRIRCGGILGTTYNQGFLSIATDHAFGFNANVQKCDIGGNLPQSRHKPLFVKVLKN